MSIFTLFSRRRIEGLSKPELRVLEGMAEGQTVEQIAEKVHRSPHTIKTHVAKVYDKLGVRNAPHAIAAAFRRGLLR